MSATPDSTLANPEQLIADLQRQLSEREAELAEAHERETATAEVLQVINTSPGELKPVFDAILAKAHSLFGVEYGVLLTYDGELFWPVAMNGAPPNLEMRNGFRPSSGFRGLLRGERLLHIHDMAEFAAKRPEEPVYRDLFESGGIRTQLAVPLRKDGRLLGIITANRREVRPFSDKQIALLENFAAQAVIAMENARLITETREALEQQTATAEVLQVINSSPGNLNPVFEAIVEKALALCGASEGLLRIFDGESFHLVAEHGETSNIHRLRELAPIPKDSPFWEPLVRGERVSHLVDARETEPYRERPDIREKIELLGIRTWLAVALNKEEALLGAIALYRQEVRPFTDKQIALLENFAAQAVIAMENGRLLTETREALDQQTATAEVLGVINSSPGELVPVFEAMLDKAMRLCSAAFGYLLTYDGELFQEVAHQGLPPRFAEYLPRMDQPGPSGAYARIKGGAPMVYITDLKEGDVYNSSPLRQALVDLGGARTGIIVALRKDETLLGVLTIYRQEVRPFSDKQIALLQNFAAQAVIAMENARLLTETREALERQTATAEVLQVINSFPGDLKPVFDTMLEKALNLCDAAFGVLWTKVDESYQASALSGIPPSYADFLTREPRGPEPGGVLGRLVRGEALLHIPNTGATTPSDETGRTHAELSGARAVLGVPLSKENIFLGAFVIYRREARPFSDKQIALLQNFAAQAVIAMENARLITETHEALEQQTATTEVLQVINSSPGDLAPVFDAMLDKALDLCEAAFGNLWTYEGGLFHAKALRRVPQVYTDYLLRTPVPASAKGTVLAQLLAGNPSAQVADAATDGAYTKTAARMLVELGGGRTVAGVALRRDEELLGAITIYRQEVHPFTDKQIALLQNFAAQAVIAMENARLLTETREALEQQTATAEVLQVINSSPGDLAPVFDAMLEKATRLCEAPFGILRTWDGERFHFGAVHGDPRVSDWVRRRHPIQPEPDNSPLGRILQGGRFVHVADVSTDESSRTSTGFREMITESGLRSSIMVALRKEDVLVGTITVYRQEVRPFSDKQIALLENFAAQAVIAMDNARLLGELRQRTEEVAELNLGLEARVAEQVEELGRVGRLKRFLAPQLAELIVSQGDEKILESHRREIVVVFCDLRGYTAFTETAEPEEVLAFLREYHGALGPLVSQYEGTLDQFSGDGIMVFFNDPVPCPDPAERAVRMAMAMREAAGKLIGAWRRHGSDLGFGAGIAQGYATLGQIGFSDRSGYTAIGTVCNLAARLCSEAKDRQILVSSRIAEAVEAAVKLEDLGNLELKGLRRPVAAFNVVQSTSATDARPNLTVVARGPGV